MRIYRFFNQRENFCIPACLQSVFDRRGIEVPHQQAIANELGFNGQGVFIGDDLEPLRGFLGKWDLSVDFYSPYQGIVEPDVFLKEIPDEDDVMVGFMYSQLYGNGRNRSHFALLSSFTEGGEREIFLHDNQRGRVENVSLADLVRSMRDESQCGFYTITSQ